MGTLIIKAGINNTRSKIEEIDEKNKKEESELTSNFRRSLVKKLVELEVVNNYGKDNDREWILKHNGIENIALDFHFNLSQNENINGTEVVIPFHSTDQEKEIGRVFKTIVTNSLNTKDRGLKYECNNYRGQLLFITSNFKNYCIELCFLTNEKDMIQYNENKTILINNISNYLKTIL